MCDRPSWHVVCSHWMIYLLVPSDPEVILKDFAGDGQT